MQSENGGEKSEGGGAGGRAEEGENKILTELKRKQAELKAVVSCMYHNSKKIFAGTKFHEVASSPSEGIFMVLI